MKKKLSLTIVSLMCLGVLGLQSCNDTSSVTETTSQETTSEEVTSEETTSTEDVVYTSVSITNKDELQETWKLEEADRTVDITTDPVANTLSLLNDGTIVVTSSDSAVVSVNGKKLTAVGAGTATITVTLTSGETVLTDTVDITVEEAAAPLTIAEVRALESGTLTKTRGYITRIMDDGSYAVIADGETAIVLYGYYDYVDTFEVGDMVLANGTYSPYNGLAEIGSLTSIVEIDASENTDVLAPVDLTVTDIAAIPDGSDGRIVDIEGMTLVSVDSAGAFDPESGEASRFTVELSLGETAINMSVDYHNGFETQKAIYDKLTSVPLTSTVDYHGLLSAFNGYQLAPMSADEITVTAAELTEAESLAMLQEDLGELDFSAGVYEIANLPVADQLGSFSVAYEVSSELTDIVSIDAATGEVTVTDVYTATTGTITATITDSEDAVQGEAIVIDVTIAASVVEPDAVGEKTLADLVAVEEADFKMYKYTGVTGYVSNLKDGDGSKYGNFDVASDLAGTDKLVVYGATASTGAIKFDNHTGSYYFSNPKDFLTNEFTSAIAADDEITFNAIRYAYGDTQEVSIEITAINGVSTIPAATETVDIVSSGLGYADAETVTGENLTSKVNNENLTFTIDQGGASNPAKYYDNGEAIRLYQGGATLSFTSTKTVVGFSVTFADGYNGLDDEAVFAGVDAASAVAVTESNTFEASEGIKFGQIKSGTEKGDRAYISEIEITYLSD